MPLENLVSGPHPLTDSKLIVPEGLVAVILRNGRVVSVKYPGLSGGLWNVLSWSDQRLPMTGDLQYMFFSTAPLVLLIEEPDVPLQDGSRISVAADVEVTPVWASDPASLEALIKRYGTKTDTYVDLARASLQGDFRAMMRSALQTSGHAELHAVAENRNVASNTQGRGILALSILDVRFGVDSHQENIYQLRQNFMIEAEHARFEEDLFKIKSALQIAQERLANNLDSERKLSQAQADRAAAEIYGVRPWDVAYPEQLSATQEHQQTLVSSLLTEYADVVPLISESLGTDTAGLLKGLLGTDRTETMRIEAGKPDAEQVVDGGREKSTDDNNLIEASPDNARLLGAVPVYLNNGSVRVLRIIPSGENRESFPDDALIAFEGRNQLDTASNILQAIGEDQHVVLSVDPIKVRGCWRLIIKDIEAVGSEVDRVDLGNYLSAMAKLFAGANPPVTLEIGESVE